jgi:hypothetical protein
MKTKISFNENVTKTVFCFLLILLFGRHLVLVLLVKKLTLEMLEVDLEVIPELLTVQLGGQNLQSLDHLQAVDLLDVLRILLPVELKKEIVENVAI